MVDPENVPAKKKRRTANTGGVQTAMGGSITETGAKQQGVVELLDPLAAKAFILDTFNTKSARGDNLRR